MTKREIYLTGKQEQTLDYIFDYIQENRVAPTIREVGDYFGISPKAAYDRIMALKIKGFVDSSDPILLNNNFYEWLGYRRI